MSKKHELKQRVADMFSAIFAGILGKLTLLNPNPKFFWNFEKFLLKRCKKKPRGGQRCQTWPKNTIFRHFGPTGRLRVKGNFSHITNNFQTRITHHWSLIWFLFFTYQIPFELMLLNMAFFLQIFPSAPTGACQNSPCRRPWVILRQSKTTERSPISEISSPLLTMTPWSWYR